MREIYIYAAVRAHHQDGWTLAEIQSLASQFAERARVPLDAVRICGSGDNEGIYFSAERMPLPGENLLPGDKLEISLRQVG